MSNPEKSPEYGGPMSPAEFMEMVKLEGRVTPPLGMTAIRSMLEAAASGDKTDIAEWQTTYAAAVNYNSERAQLQAQAAADIQEMNPHDTTTWSQLDADLKARPISEHLLRPSQQDPDEEPAA